MHRMPLLACRAHRLAKTQRRHGAGLQNGERPHHDCSVKSPVNSRCTRLSELRGETRPTRYESFAENKQAFLSFTDASGSQRLARCWLQSHCGRYLCLAGRALARIAVAGQLSSFPFSSPAVYPLGKMAQKRRAERRAPSADSQSRDSSSSYTWEDQVTDV